MKKQLAALLLGALAAPAFAAEAIDASAEVLVERDGVELRERLAMPPDVDVFDSAIVFSNTSNVRAAVACRGFDHDGAGVGRIRVVVPPNGLRFALTSDLADGDDFLGRVVCTTANLGVIGSAYLLGGGEIEGLPVDVVKRRVLQMTVPVTLTR